MNLYLITFQSSLNRIESVYDCHKDLFVEIEKFFTLHLVPYTEAASIPADAYRMAFIASGGVEKMVTQHFELLPYPIHLLTDGQQNSLAASLEIATWIRSKGMKVHIIHGTIPNMVKQLIDHHKAFAAQREVRGKRIGVVASVFANRAIACREGTPEDLLKAMRLYQAVKIICEKKKLDAVTLSCFSLIEKLGTTGCLALALLNDEGIPAGCEGDLQSIFTLLIAKTLTGQAGFMANPAFINDDQNEIVMAHCTIATKMVDQFIIRNHFETETGIAIQGILHPGGITMIKCAGECLDEYFVSTGQLIENTNYINACRTQARIKLDKPVDYFMRNPLGNHHIILMGDHEKVIHEFMQLNSCKLVE